MADTQRAAMQQALEALAPLANATTPAEREALTDADAQAADAASCDLRAALAEQAARDEAREIKALVRATRCQCGDRHAAQCPGAWEPGCDLGNNEKYVRVAAPAAEQAEPVRQPKLIGWRTENFLHETSDREVAKTWEPHIGVLPIFEGDPNTSLLPNNSIGGGNG